MRRVVVTGMGAVTPVGIGIENFWNSIKEKKTGFDKITKFDTTGFKASLAAEIKDFDPKEFMDFKAARRMELFCQYAVAAAAEAMENAGIDMEKEDPYRVGCYVGSGIGSLQAMEREHKRLLERGASRINPLLVPLMISNMACGNVSIQLGLCDRNPFHRRSVPQYSDRRCRCDRGRRYRSSHLSDGGRRIFRSDGTVFCNRSETLLHPV